MSDRTTSGREYFEWIELHQSFCSNRFGDGVESSAATGACMATLAAPGDEKCHNTLSTCPRTDNYVEGSLVLRFCKDGPVRPSDGEYYFPLLVSTRITPASINPGVGNRDKGALGTRAQLSATFRDGPHPDTLVDPYLAERLIGVAQYDGIGYNPFERSTFWRKWAARNLYKLNRRVVHCGGYIDAAGVVSDIVRREFWVSGFSGPNGDGSVTIDGLDILARIADEKAQIPAPSTGKLDAGITEASVAATLTPAGVGDDEYPASGWVCIGDEVIEFTRTGDVLTLVTRGDFGTTADDHDAGATVQLCERFDAVTPSEILQRALPFAGIDVSEYCDLAQWADETYTFLPRLYSTLIPRPVGVYQVVSEVQEHMYLYVWLDERDGLIKLRAVRPASDEEVTALTESSILALTSREQPEQRLSRVVINYAMRDYTRPLDEATNYRVTDIVGAFAEELPDRSGGPMTRVINSRWLDATDGAAAVELGERLLARYQVPPRRVSFALDAKDRALWVGDFVSLQTSQHVDRFGLPVPIPAQVMAVAEDVPGHRFTYDAQQFVFEGAAGAWSVEVSTDVDNVNLRTLFDDKFASMAPSGSVIEFTVRAGVYIGSTSTATEAVNVGTWPGDVSVVLKNYGSIVGAGGAGGAGGDGSGPSAGGDGGDGGDAIVTTNAVTVENYGLIAGGGGGGGGGGYGGSGSVTGYSRAGGCGGGGGAGKTAGAGGVKGLGYQQPTSNAPNGTDGSAGSVFYGGGAGTGNSWGANGGGRAGRGGYGGDLGQAGVAGQAGQAGSKPDAGGAAGAAGAAGRYAVGNSYITWTVAGDRRGGVV